VGPEHEKGPLRLTNGEGQGPSPREARHSGPFLAPGGAPPIKVSLKPADPLSAPRDTGSLKETPPEGAGTPTEG